MRKDFAAVSDTAGKPKTGFQTNELIAAIDGDRSNVVGLPVGLLASLLVAEGVAMPSAGGNPARG